MKTPVLERNLRDKESGIKVIRRELLVSIVQKARQESSVLGLNRKLVVFTPQLQVGQSNFKVELSIILEDKYMGSR